MNSAAYVKGKTPHGSSLEPRRAFIYAAFRCTIVVGQIEIGVIGALTLIVARAIIMRHNCIYELGRLMPTKRKSESPKAKALLEEGTLNPNPEKVRDRNFQQNEFFDPRDLVQVRYEMLRRVSIENRSVTDATEEYGVSRPTYY